MPDHDKNTQEEDEINYEYHIAEKEHGRDDTSWDIQNND